MSRRDISKRGNKREMLSYEAWTDGRTAVCHNKPVFWRGYKNEWPISWNYEYIIFGQIIFQNFHQFKAFVGLSNCGTIGPSDYRTVGLSDCRIIATAPLIKGVPQGSILDQFYLMFLINDIVHFVQDSTIYNYADDNTLSYSDTNINTVVKTLENDSINLIDWFSKNLM